MNKRTHNSMVVFSLFFCLALPWNVRAGESSQALVFGFLPILSPQKLVARFGPLTDYLAEQLNRPVRLETAPNYEEFVRRTSKQRYDILFTAPHFYYLAQRQSGYRVLVRVDAPTMPAVIVARKDSDIHNLEDLRGKKLSTVDPLALGTALVKAHLSANNIDPDKDVTLVTTPTHNASLLSAYKRVTDAASLMLPPYNRAKPEIKNNMIIIAKTAGTPHMPISVSSSVSAEKRSIIENALLNLTASTKGKELLQHLSWPGFAKTSPAEYDQLEWAAKQIQLTE